MIDSNLLLSNIELSIDMPALDPLIIDCTNCEDLPSRVLSAYNYLVYRLMQGGFNDIDNIYFIALPYTIEKFPNDYPVKLIKDECMESNAYLLTLSSAGRNFFVPPDDMSWDDYFLSFVSNANGPKSLRALVPWAQAKFLNVS